MCADAILPSKARLATSLSLRMWRFQSLESFSRVTYSIAMPSKKTSPSGPNGSDGSGVIDPSSEEIRELATEVRKEIDVKNYSLAFSIR